MSSRAASRAPARSRWRSHVSIPLLAALLPVDLVLVAASVTRLVVSGHSYTDPWLLETDGGWAERFGYLQQAAIAALLVCLALLARRWIFAAFAVVYASALADDSLRLHENKGAWLVERLDNRLWFP